MSTSLSTIADRYRFSQSAVAAALDALRRGNGIAQFDHAELGGHGQWMSGMVMIGRMGDQSLKGRVGALFADLLPLIDNREGVNEVEPMKPMQPMKPMSPMIPMTPMEPMKPMRGSSIDAPADWGSPASAGGQNGAQYAWFSKARRLVVEQDGRRTVYDTAEHDISGVSQSQSDWSSGKLVFSSSQGAIQLDSLRVVG